MDWTTASIVMAGGLFVLLLLGVPVAASLGVFAMFFMIYALGLSNALQVLGTEFNTLWTNYTFLSAPLFILLGEFLFSSGITSGLFDITARLLPRMRGSAAVVTIITCAILATCSGSTMAATAAVGVIAIPEMLSRGYDKRLATGAVGAAGGLAHLIPPSILMVVYATMTEQSVGKMFMAGFMPGIVLAILLCGVVFIWVKRNPNAAPTDPSMSKLTTWREKLQVLKPLLPSLILIFSILGTIYSGIATATEAAGIGTLVAGLLYLFSGKASRNGFRDILLTTSRITSFTFLLVLGGTLFSWTLTYYQVPQHVMSMLIDAVHSPWLVLVIIQIVYIILGMFIDNLSIMVISVPVIAPMFTQLGFDPIWFGILYLINMEMAFITPPFGLNLFIIQSIVKGKVSFEDITKGCLVFAIADLICLILVMVFPSIALWLPSTMR